MEDSNSDYLTKYREFIESLLRTTDLDYPLPVNISKYNIAEFEITGEVLSWCLQYLNERKCPNSLAAPLCCKVLEEILQVAKEDPDSCGYRTHEDDFQPLKLMQKTIKKLVDVCIYYTDNAKLSTLLPPPTSTLLDPPVSLCGVKNSRRKMEDRHVAIQDLHALFNIKDCGSASYYAVFDGHNGVDAAAYSACHVHQYLVESPHYPHNPELALKEAFKKTDDRFVDKSNKENLDSGTTALCALLRPNESMLYVAWLGDSQAVLVSQGKAYQLVKPHRPDQPDERQRINDMGGTVLYLGTWRVNGHLAVSRAIGDRKYKPFVVGDPDVRVIPLTGKEEFIILASDGLWDFVPENEAVNAVYEYLQTNKGKDSGTPASAKGDVNGISKQLVQLAKSRFSRDNISVVVVFLSEPEPYKGRRMEASEVEHIWRESYVSKAPPNQFEHDDDDLSPENDAVHDVLSSGFPADAAKAKALVVQSQAMEEWMPSKFEPSQKEFLKSLPWTYADALKKPRPPEKSLTVEKRSGELDFKGKSSQQTDIILTALPELISVSDMNEPESISEEESKGSVDIEDVELPEIVVTSLEDAHAPQGEKTEEPTQTDELPEEPRNDDVDVAEAEVDSAEDSEEEWNYIPGKENKKSDKKPQAEEPIDDEDDMSRLNPDAAEFVPDFGKLDRVLASSPAKGAEKSIEDVPVPKQNVFLADISTKPGELDSIGYECNLNETSVNGVDSTVDSTKAICGEDPVYDDADDVPPPSSNPFSSDAIEMVSDYFSENQLGFKPFDQMQESIVVLDSTSSPTAPAEMDTYDFLSNTDKPDLLSPIAESNDVQQQKTGFESEISSDLEVVGEKCDLVANIPLEPVEEVPTEHHNEELLETNPFSADHVSQPLQSEELDLPPGQTTFDDGDKVDVLPPHEVDESLENFGVSKLPEEPHTEEPHTEEPLAEEPVQAVPPQINQVDLISELNEPESEPAPVVNAPEVTVLETETKLGEVDVIVQSPNLDDIQPDPVVQEVQNNFLSVDERAKEESGDSDGFEMINHDEADLIKGMNGIHIDEDHSPDSYKIDDLIQHSVEIHEKPKFENDFMDENRHEELAVQESGMTESFSPEVQGLVEPQVVPETNDLLGSFGEHEIKLVENAQSLEPEHVVEEVTKSVFQEVSFEAHVEEMPQAVTQNEVVSPVEEEVIVKNDVPNNVPADAIFDSPEDAIFDSPATPSAPLSEDILSNDISEEVKDEPKPTLDVPEKPSEEIKSEDVSKMNGDIADVATPPSTPAPGVEVEDKQGDLIAAAAIAAAGAATVAAVATVAAAAAEDKPAKPDSKAVKKPATGKTDVKSAAKPLAKSGVTAAAKKPSPTATKAPVAAAKTTTAARPSAAKPAAPKPATGVAKTTATTVGAAKPKPATPAVKAAPAKPAVGAGKVATATKAAPVAAKAPVPKPKTPTTTIAPIKKPAAPTTTVTKTVSSTSTTTRPAVGATKPAAAAAKPATTARSTLASRPSSASKSSSASSTTRPSSATKPTTTLTKTTTVTRTTTAAKPAVGAAKPAAAKPAAAARPSATTKPASATKPAPAKTTVPPRPKPAAPTVLKKPAAADKTTKDKPATKPPPIKKPVDPKKVDKEPPKIEQIDQVEPPMQEPIVSTTNGHVDFIENGLSPSEDVIVHPL